MEETIYKVSAIFDKMASVKITPTSNYSVPEYWMNRAIKGDEKCKDNLFNFISLRLNIDKSILNAVFNAKYNKTNENKLMNKKLIRLKESDLHRIVKESVDKILSESEIGDRVNTLKGMSRTYKKDLTDNDNELSKTWNRGMGLQSFIEVLPDEGVILYNSLQTYNRDLQRIQQVFPEYKLVKVDKPFYSHSSLRAHRNGTAR